MDQKMTESVILPITGLRRKISSSVLVEQEACVSGARFDKAFAVFVAGRG
jgi:hypothetical protein